MNYSILLPSKPYLENESPTHGEVVIEGLHPGYGMTIGNALRRVLFSSLPGAAVTRVKIEGVNHEFSTIPGVLEDVLLILLNIKQLRFRVFSEHTESVSFEFSGVRDIKAGDIKAPSSVEIVNKDQHIATLTKKNARLAIEFWVERGVGYKPKEVVETGRVEAGAIVLDAIFTPVRKISYNVENMRVGSDTDYNRLTFNIETDGTITPREAFMKGLDILTSQLEELRTFRTKGEFEPSFEKEKISENITEQSEPEHDYANILIDDVKFSSHTLNALTRNNIKTLGELSQKTEKELRMLDGIGEKAIQEIHRELGNCGLILQKE